MNKPLRILLTFSALALVIFVLNSQFQRLLEDRSILPIDDFVEYWAAGRLNAHGENPYDPAKLLPLERDAGRDTDEAVMMWNPPWTLALVMPFGLMDSRAAQLLWLLIGFLSIAASADLSWRIYDGPPKFRWVAWLLAFTFMPTFFVLAAGQIGPWMLAGVVLFLLGIRRGWPILAGAATVLLALKPHLTYLFWIALIVWGIRRDRRVLVGGLLMGLAATVIAVLWNPPVLQQYWEAMTQRPPAQWQSPTLGTLLRMIEGEANFGLQFVPGLLGVGWLIGHSWRCRAEKWDWPRQMPMLLLVSFVTASYGAWPFDLIVLLPAAIQIAADIARQPCRERIAWGCAAWIAINVPALAMNLLHVGSFWFIWIAPAMLGWYCYFSRSRLRARRK